VKVAIRRARTDDLDFVSKLVKDDDVEPFLAAGRPSDRDSLRADIARSDDEPERSACS
jgi:hypothetical protein